MANIEAIAKLPGVSSRVESDLSDLKAADRLLQTGQDGKLYCLTTGKHAAVVRKAASGQGYEYLELQSAQEGGERVPPSYEEGTAETVWSPKQSHSVPL